MKNFILKIVNGKEEEWSKISLLLGIGFFSGIFLATYEIIPTFTFLKYFDEKKILPYAFLTSGVLGVLFTSIFTFLQKRTDYKSLIKWTMIIATLLVISLTVAIKINTSKWVIFVIYVMHTPISAIVILAFWGVFGRLFDFRASKRLAGGIDTGQAISAILGFFTIPLIQGFIGEETNFMVGSSICMLINMILFVVIINNESFHKGEAITQQRDEKKVSKLVRRQYIRLMSLFVILSLSAAYLVNYSFLSVTGEFFSTDDDTQLLSYLSFFEGFVVIVSFLVQTFLNDKIIEVYGLKISLMLVPIILGIFTLIATGVGYIFGYTAGSEVFVFFFLMISASKLFVDALRDSLESPTIKSFFFPIDISVRFDAQTKIEGVVKESAALLIGGLLIFVTQIKMFNIIYNCLIILVLVLIWMYITSNMYKEYKKTLQETLKSSGKNKQLTDEKKPNIIEQINREIKKSTGKIQVKMLTLLNKIDFFAWRKHIVHLNEFVSDEVKEYGIRQITQENLMDLSNEVNTLLEKKELSTNITMLVQKAKLDLLTDEQNANNYQKIVDLCTSRNEDKRLYGVHLLAGNKIHQTLDLLSPLLRDLSSNVRRNALITAGKLNIESFIPILIEHLGIIGYENTALTAILHFGEKILGKLEIAFNKNGQNSKIQKAIVTIYGRLGTQNAIDLLQSKITTPNRQIFFKIIETLSDTVWKIKDNHRLIIKNALREQIENSIWILAAITEIEKNPHNQLLEQALNQEVSQNYEKIFLLLYSLYEKESVILVRENLEMATQDSIGYALELLNLFIDEDLKSIVLPFLDDTPAVEKIKKYEIHFPRSSFDNKKVLIKIINKDYNTINRWTKACAIYSYAMRSDAKVTYDLTGNLFNFNPLLCETAAWAVCTLDPVIYRDVTKRIDKNILRKLNRVIPIVVKMPSESSLKLLRFYKIKFLLSIDLFKDIYGIILIDLLECLDEIYLLEGESLPYSKYGEMEYFYIVVTGKMTLQHNEKTYKNIEEKEVIHDVLFPENQFIDQVNWKASEDSLVYRFNEQELFYLTNNYPGIFDNFLTKLKKSTFNRA